MPHVFAYLDLASGSMIVQAVIAGIVVVPVLFRNKLRALFGRGKGQESTITDIETVPVDGAGDATSVDPTASQR